MIKTLRHKPQLNTPKVLHVEMVRLIFLASTATCWQPSLTATIQAQFFAQRLSGNVRGQSGKRKAGAPIAKPMGSAISARSSRLRLALSSEWRLRLARVWAAPACGALVRAHAPSTTQIFIQYRLGPCKTLLMSRCLQSIHTSVAVRSRTARRMVCFAPTETVIQAPKTWVHANGSLEGWVNS